jgi:hypothetical protein
MRKYLVILLSLLAFLLFSSKRCDSPEGENTAEDEITSKATVDSINNSFKADHLSEQSLRAFEEKAKEKVVDFADYLQIYTDKSLDESFKKHLRQMILDLFISDTIHIILKVADERGENNLAINKFLETVSVPVENSMKIIFDSIVLWEPLQRINELNYKGTLKFSQKVELPSAINSAGLDSVSKQVDIIATKISKHFGSDTVQIWQVYLGDIR